MFSSLLLSTLQLISCTDSNENHVWNIDLRQLSTKELSLSIQSFLNFPKAASDKNLIVRDCLKACEEYVNVSWFKNDLDLIFYLDSINEFKMYVADGLNKMSKNREDNFVGSYLHDYSVEDIIEKKGLIRLDYSKLFDESYYEKIPILNDKFVEMLSNNQMLPDKSNMFVKLNKTFKSLSDDQDILGYWKASKLLKDDLNDLVNVLCKHIPFMKNAMENEILQIVQVTIPKLDELMGAYILEINSLAKGNAKMNDLKGVLNRSRFQSMKNLFDDLKNQLKNKFELFDSAMNKEDVISKNHYDRIHQSYGQMITISSLFDEFTIDKLFLFRSFNDSAIISEKILTLTYGRFLLECNCNHEFSNRYFD